MALYIWLMFYGTVLVCNQVGCTQIPIAHFDYLVGIGAVELTFEIAGILRIFSGRILKRNDISGIEVHSKRKKKK